MRPIARRTAALLAVPALSLAGLAATTAPSSAATDPGPARAAATWLDGQVPSSGLFQGQFGDDYGLSIDVALALHDADPSSGTATTIRDAVADHVNDYIAFSYTDSSGAHSGESGGATAKALVLAQRTGGTPTSFGGVDLVQRLDSLIDGQGRVISTFDGAPDPSYDNTYIQTLAVSGLEGTTSTKRAAAVTYLLAQQCSTTGYFRGDIPEGASDPCADTADTDSTAQAVLALQGDTAAAAARQQAVTWLLAAQKKSGAFGGGVATKPANANSTGLAAVALLAAGKDAAAGRAAAWLRAHQAANVGSCVPYAAADLGAVLYDDAARKAAQGGPMDAGLHDQSIRATSQVIAGLAAAPQGPGTPNVLSAPGYVPAGGTTSVGVNDATPGEPLCATLGEQSVLGWANPAGDASLRVTVPARAGTSTVTVANAGGELGDATLTALGAKKLTVSLKSKRVAGGKKQVITVKGLAPAEMASVGIDWPARKHSASGGGTGGQANAKGVFRVTVKVPKRHPGTAKVKATGEFKNRTGSTSFVVTR